MNAKSVFEREIQMLQAHIRKLDKDALNNSDALEARYSEQTAWDLESIVKYLEQRVAELAH